MPAFKVRGGPIIAVAALILAMWLLANGTLREAVTAVIAAAVGIIIYLSIGSIAGRLELVIVFSASIPSSAASGCDSLVDESAAADDLDRCLGESQRPL